MGVFAQVGRASINNLANITIISYLVVTWVSQVFNTTLIFRVHFREGETLFSVALKFTLLLFPQDLVDEDISYFYNYISIDSSLP